MTKPLEPDIKALRAINHALAELPDDAAVRRVLEWTVARAAKSRRFHYFREGRSLCGKWVVFVADSEVPWDRPADGDCAACKKKAPA